MKWRSSLVLFAVSLGLLAFVWLWDSGQKSTQDAARSAGRLFTFEASAVRWIELDQDGTTLRFERRAPAAVAAAATSDASGDGTTAAPPQPWRMTRPLDDRADQALLDSIADRIARLESSRQLGVPDAEGRASASPPDDQAGLAPPRYVLRFDAGSEAAPEGPSPAEAAAGSAPAPDAGDVRTLQVGRDIPGSKSLYVRVSGRAGLDVADRGLVEGLDRPVDGWRDRALFNVTTLELGEAEISRPEGSVRFKRVGESWRVAAPFDDEAAGSKVQSLLFTVAGLHAVSFAPADDPAGLAALAVPTHRIVLSRRDGTRAGEFVIGAAVEGSDTRLWARAADRQGLAQVDRAILDTLGGAAETYRSMQAFTIGEYSTAKISLTKGGVTLAFDYKDGAWVATEPAGLTPAAGSVEGTVNAAAGLQASAIAGTATGLGQYGLESSAATITLVARADEAAGPALSETLRLGKATGIPGQIYAMKDGRPVVLAIPDTILARFDRKTYETPPQDPVPGAEISGTVGNH